MAGKKTDSSASKIKHGGFFNDDCVYCFWVENISWVAITALVIVGVLFFILSDSKNGILYSVTFLVAYILSFLTRKWWRKLSVQSHGLYFDKTGDQGWIRDKHIVEGRTDDEY